MLFSLKFMNIQNTFSTTNLIINRKNKYIKSFKILPRHNGYGFISNFELINFYGINK